MNESCDNCKANNEDCKRCNICIHTASCSCTDNFIYGNICIHIHFIYREFIKNNKVALDFIHLELAISEPTEQVDAETNLNVPGLDQEPNFNQPDFDPEPNFNEPDLDPESDFNGPDFDPEPNYNQPDLDPEPNFNKPDLDLESNFKQPDLEGIFN